MSKKSSTFVPGFNSGAHDFKCYNVMIKKVCVFKAWGGNCWLRVLAVRKRPELPIIYRVMMGRNLLDGINEFEEKGAAIDKAVRLAKADALGAMEGLFV